MFLVLTKYEACHGIPCPICDSIFFSFSKHIYELDHIYALRGCGVPLLGAYKRVCPLVWDVVSFLQCSFCQFVAFFSPFSSTRSVRMCCFLFVCLFFRWFYEPLRYIESLLILGLSRLFRWLLSGAMRSVLFLFYPVLFVLCVPFRSGRSFASPCFHWFGASL